MSQEQTRCRNHQRAAQRRCRHQLQARRPAQSIEAWAQISKRDAWFAVLVGALVGLWAVADARAGDKVAVGVLVPPAAGVGFLFAMGAVRWVAAHARVLMWLAVAGAAVWAVVAFGSVLAAPVGGVPTWVVLWLTIEMDSRNSRRG